jgi:hypothetical protein
MAPSNTNRIVTILLLSVAMCSRQLLKQQPRYYHDTSNFLGGKEIVSTPQLGSQLHNQLDLINSFNGTTNLSNLPSTSTPANGSILASLKRIAFFHIGKTGGTTLLTSLLQVGCSTKVKPQRRHDCMKNITMQNSILSQKTDMLIHLHQVFPRGPIEQERIQMTPGLLFSIREPIARFESAYYYESPFHCHLCQENQRRYQQDSFGGDYRAFYQSFPTLDNLTMALDRATDDNKLRNTETAIAILRKVFQSSNTASQELRHLSAGYQYYIHHWAKLPERTQPPTTTTVLAIRTERLWKDAEKIETMLGGNSNAWSSSLQHKRVSHGSEHQIRRVPLMDGSRQAQILCCALSKEIQSYQRIVELAVNLNATEKQETFEWTWQRCAVSSWDELHYVCSKLSLTLNLIV